MENTITISVKEYIALVLEADDGAKLKALFRDKIEHYGSLSHGEIVTICEVLGIREEAEA